MSDSNNNDLRSKYEKNSTIAERLAMLILLGLAVEIVAVFILKKPILEAILTISATALIWLGVWGELLFEKRAREAGGGIVAEANARAAEANQRAQEAILELAELRAPRELTPEQRGRIVDELKLFSGAEYDIALSNDDPEILNFVFIIELVLSTTGWMELDWQGNGEGFIREGMPIIRLGASVVNVMIGVHVSQPLKLFEHAVALSDALMAEGIDATATRLTPHRMSSTNANAIHILMGRKL
jgi:hypothetical protein